MNKNFSFVDHARNDLAGIADIVCGSSEEDPEPTPEPTPEPEPDDREYIAGPFRNVEVKVLDDATYISVHPSDQNPFDIVAMIGDHPESNYKIAIDDQVYVSKSSEQGVTLFTPEGDVVDGVVLELTNRGEDYKVIIYYPDPFEKETVTFSIFTDSDFIEPGPIK